jgi:hypothetical protein
MPVLRLRAAMFSGLCTLIVKYRAGVLKTCRARCRIEKWSAAAFGFVSGDVNSFTASAMTAEISPWNCSADVTAITGSSVGGTIFLPSAVIQMCRCSRTRSFIASCANEVGHGNCRLKSCRARAAMMRLDRIDCQPPTCSSHCFIFCAFQFHCWRAFTITSAFAVMSQHGHCIADRNKNGRLNVKHQVKLQTSNPNL